MKRIFSLIALTAAMFAAIAVDAATLSETDAGIAASRWARRSRLGVRLTEQRSGTRRYVTSRGDVFYGVRLGTSGSVIVGDVGGSARVLAFSRQPLGVISTNSPLYALVSRDLALRAVAFAEVAEGTVEAETDIDDLRVSPFVTTKWSQGDAYTAEDPAAAEKCYNLHTPELELTFERSDGSEYIPVATYRTPCGCVATAMAQTLRYWKLPSGHDGFDSVIHCLESPSVVVYDPYTVYSLNDYPYYTKGTDPKHLVYVDESVTRQATTYNWDDMAECPLDCSKDEYGKPVWSGNPVTESQREAIGELTYDCGVAVGLRYSFNGTGLATSDMANIALALTNLFGYASAIIRNSLYNQSLTEDSAERARAILANLDARRPTILLVNGNRGGHAVVADGYGFVGSSASPYVHLNMGWSGQCDIWYNLPEINTSENPEQFSGFSIINGAVYNITPYPAQVGEIVSGRVTGSDGAPVSNLVVEAYGTAGTLLKTAVTDDCGIYHFVLPASADGYDIFCAVSGQLVGDVYSGPVDKSTDDMVGNSWGNDMVLGLPAARAGERLFTDFRHAVEYAQRVGEPLVEVLNPCTVRQDGDIAISADLAIVATNDSPRLAAVVFGDDGGKFSVADGVRLSLSNVVFTSVRPDRLVTVDVASNSVVAVAGTVIVDSIVTAAADGFELAGPLKSGIEIKCLIAKEAGSVFGVASFADAADYADYVFNGFDPELAGVAEDGVLKWADEVPVPLAAAYAVFVGGSGTNCCRSFDRLILSTSGISGPGEMHLLRRCQFTQKAEFANDRLLMSDNGDGLYVKGGGFTVRAGATLTVTNVAICGSAPNPLFTIGVNRDSKGNFVLADGASIDGYASTVRQTQSGGAVSVQYGTARLLAGSVIDGCSVTAANLHGGGVYLRTVYAGLELAGGAISNCVAGSTGGGVYADGRSTIRVTAPSFVVGNSAVGSDGITTTDSDVYVNGGDIISRFVLAGDAAGSSIGVDRVDGSVGAPRVGDAFMSVEVDAQTATNSASAFFSNDADLTGAVSGDAKSLVWMDAPDPNQCEPDRAVAVVVYDEDGETNYYSTVLAALVGLRGDAAVFVATNYISDAVGEKDWYIYGDVEIQYNVRLCTADGAETPATIFRDFRANSLTSILRPCTLFVRPGATLTLSNIVFKGACTVAMPWAKYPLFAVDGGTLVMEDGTKIVDIEQWGSRASGAVNVYNDGVFRMLGGTIRNIVNSYESTEADYGVGAGVLVDGGTAYFEGGSVDNCTATRYAGVYVGNGGKAYVSGGFSATGSVTYATAERPAVDSNIAVQDLSTLVLTAPLTGTIGFNEGVKASTNIFGEVGCELTDEVVASATNFHHDVTGALGAVATNAEGRAVLVWSSAFPAGEDSFEENGEVYYRVEPTPPPPPGYTIHYVGGDGATGSMDDSFCLYGKVYNLRKCTLSKGGARFAGWAWNGRLYDDGILIFNLSDVPGDELDFVAVWVDE
ncbi:MAG: C10 family peptidase [Kiritimatiellae bacterium]|nr:C10 family peptidase [Kiritimatiellia bacterium]